jgi:AcrR family transcriptional regulator
MATKKEVTVARTGTRKRREALSPERIEDAALALIEEVGLEDFSTRKLAAALGCEAMSIYHYFPSKAHLMDALLDRVIDAMARPPADLPWRDRLRQVGFNLRATALRYPRFFQFLALHRMNTRGGLTMLENILDVFAEAGFETEMMARLFRVTSYYLMGAALDETAGYAKGPSAVEPVPSDVVARDFPRVTAVNAYFKPQHHEATFALGLEIMLDGIERALAASAASGSAARSPRSPVASPPTRSRRSSSR